MLSRAAPARARRQSAARRRAARLTAVCPQIHPLLPRSQRPKQSHPGCLAPLAKPGPCMTHSHAVFTQNLPSCCRLIDDKSKMWQLVESIEGTRRFCNESYAGRMRVPSKPRKKPLTDGGSAAATTVRLPDALGRQEKRLGVCLRTDLASVTCKHSLSKTPVQIISARCPFTATMRH